MGGKRQAGWPSLLVTFLLATQEKSDSVAEGDRPLFALNATSARASRASALLQGMRRLARRLKCDSCLRRNDEREAGLLEATPIRAPASTPADRKSTRLNSSH